MMYVVQASDPVVVTLRWLARLPTSWDQNSKQPHSNQYIDKPEILIVGAFDRNTVLGCVHTTFYPKEQAVLLLTYVGMVCKIQDLIFHCVSTSFLPVKFHWNHWQKTGVMQWRMRHLNVTKIIVTANTNHIFQIYKEHNRCRSSQYHDTTLMVYWDVNHNL